LGDRANGIGPEIPEYHRCAAGPQITFVEPTPDRAAVDDELRKFFVEGRLPRGWLVGNPFQQVWYGIGADTSQCDLCFMVIIRCTIIMKPFGQATSFVFRFVASVPQRVSGHAANDSEQNEGDEFRSLDGHDQMMKETRD
jgi:hypothetical protein